MLQPPVSRENLSVSTAELRAGGARFVAEASNPTQPSVGVAGPSVSRYRAGDLIAGRYQLIEPIGSGGSGEVWLAEHTLLNTRVAVKFCLESLDQQSERAQSVLSRFRFEAQVSAQLGCKTRHIVLVHDAGKDHNGPFVVMEYAPGRGLDQLIDSEGPLGPERVARIIAQIADALTVAHASGIAHRDLKPANILIVPEGDEETAKLADFGIAKALSPKASAGGPNRGTLRFDSPTKTAHGMVVGTPDYMSPERIRGERADARGDLWALAVVAYEALTGSSPFRSSKSRGTMLSILTNDFDPPSRLRRGLPSGLDAWFKKAFHEDPARRFASAKEMSDAFSARADKGRKSGSRGSRAAIISTLTATIIGAAILLPSRLPTQAAFGAPEPERSAPAETRAAPSCEPEALKKEPVAAMADARCVVKLP